MPYHACAPVEILRFVFRVVQFLPGSAEAEGEIRMDPRSPRASEDLNRDSVATTLPLPGQLLLTVPQVARLLGMSAKAIYHRAERGQLPGVVRVGRSLRFRRADLLGSLSEGRGLSPKASR